MKTILIMGLSGSGKSTLSDAIKDAYTGTVYTLNGDEVRKANNDWDFSKEGRIRQAKRMAKIVKEGGPGWKNKCILIVDFICPTKETRKLFNADITIWMDTIKECQFEDTNQMFEPPSEDEVDYHILTQDAEFWAEVVIKGIYEK